MPPGFVYHVYIHMSLLCISVVYSNIILFVGNGIARSFDVPREIIQTIYQYYQCMDIITAQVYDDQSYESKDDVLNEKYKSYCVHILVYTSWIFIVERYWLRNILHIMFWNIGRLKIKEGPWITEILSSWPGNRYS